MVRTRGRSSDRPKVRWWDITQPVGPDAPRFPGDPSVRIERISSGTRRVPYSVTRISLGSHSGTHVDAPRHFFRRGRGVDRLELDSLIGECWVEEVSPETERISPDIVAGIPREARRVLWKTRGERPPRRAGMGGAIRPGVTTAAARMLLTRGVRLVGI